MLNEAIFQGVKCNHDKTSARLQALGCDVMNQLFDLFQFLIDNQPQRLKHPGGRMSLMFLTGPREAAVCDDLCKLMSCPNRFLLTGLNQGSSQSRTAWLFRISFEDLRQFREFNIRQPVCRRSPLGGIKS